MVHLKKLLKKEKIRTLRFHEGAYALVSDPIQKVLETMKEKKVGAAILVESSTKKHPVGIFTERDVLTKIIQQKINLSKPVGTFMTPSPKTLSQDHTMADIIQLMNQGGYRHIPIVDEKGDALGIVTARDILKYLAEHFPYEVYNLPPDPRQIIRTAEGA